MFKGKAIYNPSGKAGEYSYWACNFYVGCPNDCSYCYCKKGVLSSAMGGKTATLKKCFKSYNDAFEVFLKEMNQNLADLKKNGLFFTFTSDPLLPETKTLHLDAALNATASDVPVKFLTKRADWVDRFLGQVDRVEYNHFYNFHADEEPFKSKKHFWAFGFTLTGHDELESGASTNFERIVAMEKLHDAGFKTFASIEPIIDLESSKEMIQQSVHCCDLFKIGLMSGKTYDRDELRRFIAYVVTMKSNNNAPKFYFKDSLLKAAAIDREYELPSNCVKRDYNLFQQ